MEGTANTSQGAAAIQDTIVQFDRPIGPIGLQAGDVNKAGKSNGKRKFALAGTTFPVVKKITPGSIADVRLGTMLKFAIVEVNGVSMQGKTAHDVHVIVRNTQPGSMVQFKLRPRTEKRMLSTTITSMTSIRRAAPGAAAQQRQVRRRVSVDSLGDLDLAAFDTVAMDDGEDDTDDEDDSDEEEDGEDTDDDEVWF